MLTIPFLPAALLNLVTFTCSVIQNMTQSIATIPPSVTAVSQTTQRKMFTLCHMVEKWLFKGYFSERYQNVFFPPIPFTLILFSQSCVSFPPWVVVLKAREKSFLYHNIFSYRWRNVFFFYYLGLLKIAEEMNFTSSFLKEVKPCSLASLWNLTETAHNTTAASFQRLNSSKISTKCKTSDNLFTTIKMCCG